MYSRHVTGSVNCENSSVCFVMKYCPTSTVFRKPASVQIFRVCSSGSSPAHPTGFRGAPFHPKQTLCGVTFQRAHPLPATPFQCPRSRYCHADYTVPRQDVNSTFLLCHSKIKGVCTHAGSGPSRVRRRLLFTCLVDPIPVAINRSCCESLSTRSLYFCNKCSCAGTSVEGVGVIINNVAGSKNGSDCPATRVFPFLFDKYCILNTHLRLLRRN